MKSNNAAAKPSEMTQAIERALRRARRQARKVARMYGTPFYTMKNGKIVAEKL
jgi:ribosomal protein S5